MSKLGNMLEYRNELYSKRFTDGVWGLRPKPLGDFS